MSSQAAPLTCYLFSRICFPLRSFPRVFVRRRHQLPTATAEARSPTHCLLPPLLLLLLHLPGATTRNTSDVSLCPCP